MCCDELPLEDFVMPDYRRNPMTTVQEVYRGSAIVNLSLKSSAKTKIIVPYDMNLQNPRASISAATHSLMNSDHEPFPSKTAQAGSQCNVP
jgi:hypothetical protein